MSSVTMYNIHRFAGSGKPLAASALAGRTREGGSLEERRGLWHNAPTEPLIGGQR